MNEACNKDTNKLHGITTAIVCALIYGGVVGVTITCRGVFSRSFMAEFSISISTLSGVYLAAGIAGALSMAVWKSLFQRYAVRYVIFPALLLYTGMGIALACCKQAFLFCAFAVAQGFSTGFLVYYPISVIIGNWFPKNKGMVLSIVLMSSGLLGIFLSPIASSWIESWGWRRALLSLYAVCAVMSYPGALFFLHKDPNEIGCEPVVLLEQGKGKKRKGSDEAFIDTMRGTIPLFSYMLMIGLVVGLSQQLPHMSVSFGMTEQFGALLVSAAMAGNLTGKASLGILNDLLGSSRAARVGTLIVACGLMCLLVGTHLTMPVGAFLCGSAMSLLVIETPLLFQDNCNRDVFARMYPFACSVNSVISTVSQLYLSAGYDFLGSYRPVLFSCVLFMGIAAAFMLVLERQKKRKLCK